MKSSSSPSKAAGGRNILVTNTCSELKLAPEAVVLSSLFLSRREETGPLEPTGGGTGPAARRYLAGCGLRPEI